MPQSATVMEFEIRNRKRATLIGICLLLAILVALAFGQTVRSEFVHYDDYYYVGNNSHVTGGLTLPAVARAFTYKEGGLWTPLVTISHMLDWQLYGANAGGHHLTNVLLHLASTILLFLILRQMTGALWRCAFVAAAFAIHPLHVESVAWIAERKDVLSGFFFMLALGAYLRYVEQPESMARYLAVVLLSAMGLMCKPMLVTLPFVLLLLDYWPLRRLFQPSPSETDPGKRRFLNRRAILEKVPLLALSAGVCAVTMLGPRLPSSIDLPPVPFWVRMGEAPASFVIYLGQMIWPAGLAVIYTRYEESLPWWPAALALLGVLTLGIFRLRRKYPYLWMGWLWNLVMLAPVSGIVQISRHTRADHYNYLPQIGLYIGLTWAVADWSARWRHRRVVLGVAAGVIVIALLIAAWRQTSYWHDDIALWTHTLGSTTDNAAAHNQLGNALVLKGRIEEGIAHFREALRINPTFATAHYSLGGALIRLGRIGEGIAEFRESLRLDPARPEVHCNLGLTLLGEGRTDEAIAEFREALRINPAYALGHNDLGLALFRQGRADQGVAEFREALNLDPALAEPHCNLGNALLEQGRTEEGIAQLRQALRINPAYERAAYSLGKTLLDQGQTEEGIAELRQASRINPADAHLHNTLGIALYQQGQVEEGTSEFREAVSSDPAYSEAHNNLAKALLEQGRTGEAISEAQKAAGLQPANPIFQKNLAWMLATAQPISLRDGARALQLALKASQSGGGNDPDILRTLAAAYAEEGRYHDAIQAAQTALQAARTAELAETLRRDIKLYESGRPLPDGQ
jgi:tetratricopeptide (TPR) repeat protein